MFLQPANDESAAIPVNASIHRVLCVADDPAIVDALGGQLEQEPEFERPHCIGDTDEVMVVAKRLKPSIVLLDFERASGTSAMTILNEMRRDVPDARVVVLASAPTGELVARSLSHGAAGLLIKGLSPSRIVHAMRRVLGGEAVILLDLEA